MNVVTLTDDNFEAEVNASENLYWLTTGQLGVGLARWLAQ